MLFVIHVLDKPDGFPRRMANYDAHNAYLGRAAKHGVKIVMAGPLTSDDGATPVGSHFIIEAPDRKTAEAFHQADPFYLADVWEKPSIKAFLKRHG